MRRIKVKFEVWETRADSAVGKEDVSKKRYGDSKGEKTFHFLQLPELRISATESIRQKLRSLLGPSFLCSTTLVLEVFKRLPPGRAFPL
jgi:hypothetical protein